MAEARHETVGPPELESLIDPDHRVVLVRIAQSFDRCSDDDDLYAVTRQWWKVAEHRRELGEPTAPERATAIHRGVVQALYRLDGWDVAGPETAAQDPKRPGRWRFSGERDHAMEQRYLGADVSSAFSPGAQNPPHYVHCDRSIPGRPQ